ncbi:DUF58 domain-containing protein [Halostella sp. JP-L12]|uniref:DUF58 domain-containing protein n=1 Tax=Halostella TaxID=1843185 RepID=UPI0013CEB3A6|nr:MULTISPECIES: DUF58 domain-containing protein [Halostella]NHN48855.1 DUF58 domain-containing protein [Halostella sp. JP-L12]
MTARETGRWRVGVSAALVAGAAGVVVGNTAVFLSALVGFTYAAYGFATRTPPLDVTVERSASAETPHPAEVVAVELTVTNDGDEPISELRVADDPPAALPVVDGPPRRCVSLRPGESAALTYDVRARRGTHEFGAPTLVARNVSGSVERSGVEPVETTLVCDVDADDVALSPETVAATGRVETDAGGEGVEFHAVREYQSADPASRVDWNRYARTRELTTVEFRESRAAGVVVVLDGRDAAAAYRREGEPDGRTLARYAAESVAGELLREKDRVGAAVFGTRRGYLPPSGGSDQCRRIEALLDLDADLPDAVRKRRRRVRRASEEHYETLERTVPDGAQVVFAGPLVDDGALDALRYLRARGRAVTVVSPDVTDAATPGARVAAVERDLRIEGLRGRGIRVVDWSPDEPLRAAVRRVEGRWSR